MAPSPSSVARAILQRLVAPPAARTAACSPSLAACWAQLTPAPAVRGLPLNCAAMRTLATVQVPALPRVLAGTTRGPSSGAPRLLAVAAVSVAAGTGMSEEAASVHPYWFGNGEMLVDKWYKGGAAVDEEIRSRFGHLVEAALEGQLGPEWEATPQAALAKMVLLDQFTRNMYRGTPRAFAGDLLAAPLARKILDRGWAEPMKVFERNFAVSSPLMHSEDAADHVIGIQIAERWVREYQQAGDKQSAGFYGQVLQFAQDHHRVVQRFGRFPSRNAALGRPSTPEEDRYLREEATSEWEKSQSSKSTSK